MSLSHAYFDILTHGTSMQGDRVWNKVEQTLISQPAPIFTKAVATVVGRYCKPTFSQQHGSCKEKVGKLRSVAQGRIKNYCIPLNLSFIQYKIYDRKYEAMIYKVCLLNTRSRFKNPKLVQSKSCEMKVNQRNIRVKLLCWMDETYTRMQ